MNTDDAFNQEANPTQRNLESLGNEAEHNLISLEDELNRKFKTRFL